MPIPELNKLGCWEAECGPNSVSNYETPKAALGGLLNFMFEDGSYPVKLNELKTGEQLDVLVILDGDDIRVVKPAK